MDCWKCGRKVSDEVKIGFRAMCVHCGVDLHVCKNCRYYAPGKPNDCAVPGTEFIKDREAFKFCEEFKPKFPAQPSASNENTRRILGDEPLKKKDFGSLFKDEDGK
jgi:hypothetical protein